MKHNKTKTKKQYRNIYCLRHHLDKSKIKYNHSYRSYVCAGKYWFIDNPDDISPEDRTQDNYFKYKIKN